MMLAASSLTLKATATPVLPARPAARQARGRTGAVRTRAALASDTPSSGLQSYHLPDGWTKLEGWQLMATRAAAAGAAVAVLPASGLPPALRLAMLTYGMASTVEWGYHKFNMHEVDEVHIGHHAETNRDMSMPNDYNINAIQFPRSASIQIAAGGVPLLAALDLALQLQYPLPWVVPASLSVAIVHAGLWNTLHPDSHDVVLADDERMSDSNGAGYIQWLSDAMGPTALYQWLIINHTGHHTIRGNYNCVFPGADAVFGTFWSAKKN